MHALRPLRPLWLALAVLAAAAAPAAHADSRPDLVLKGEVTGADNHHYRELDFVAPVGVKRLTVRFSYDGAEQRTTIDLGLFDPDRFRGWSGGNKQTFTLAETDATPSYLAGPIIPGHWRLILGVPNIRQGVVSHYRAEVSFARAGERPAVSTFSDAPLKSGPGWYRGDLHDHTAHSDGACPSITGKKAPCPAFLTLQAAERRGLDFLVVSDHNTISQYGALRELQPYFDNLLVIPGREITTFEGHANALGGTAFIDFRLDGTHVRSADQLIAATHAAGGLFSINHPGVPSGESCMGCGWTARIAAPSQIDAVEVVNGGVTRDGGSVDGPISGFAFWQGLLAAGLHPTAVGGSDNHNAEAPLDALQGVGAPATVVYARDLSERAILDGLKAGHVFIDTQGTRDRSLELWVDTADGRAMMGDRVVLRAGQGVAVSVRVKAVPGGRIEWVHDLGLGIDESTSGPLAQDDTRHIGATPDGKPHWVYAKVRDAEGKLALVSNPLYFSGP